MFLKALSLVLEALHLQVIAWYGHGMMYADVPYYTTLTLKALPYPWKSIFIPSWVHERPNPQAVLSGALLVKNLGGMAS